MLSIAADIAREAGRLALERRGQVTHSDKPDGTWVTEADRAAEELIRRRLAAAFPDHRIYGEEMGGEDDLGAGECWLVDPIDGTVNYVTGLPIWGVSLGLLRGGAPSLGVFYMPVTGDLFAAEVGKGASLNGSPICPDGRGVLDCNSLVGMNSDALQTFESCSPAMLRNLGSAAAHGCYAASGGLAAAVFHHWHTWDLAAALCIALEAGAVLRHLNGTDLTTLADMAPAAAGASLVIGPEFAVEAVLPTLRRRE